MAKKSNRILNYFKEVKGELKKVVWPSFKQVKNNTLIVIACVLIIGAFIWILDLGLTKGWTLINPPAETNVEQSTEGTANEGNEISAEDLAAMLKQYNIGFDAETGVYSDLETGNELSQEEVAERLGATGEQGSTAE